MSKIEYLRVIVNSSCNLSCFFCHKEGTDCAKKGTEIDSDLLFNMIELLISKGIKKIKFLGGEPTLCKKLPDLIKQIKNITSNLNVIFAISNKLNFFIQYLLT